MSILSPPLPRRPRTAAVQSVTQPPSSGIVARRSQAIANQQTIEDLYRKQSAASRLADGPPANYPIGKVQTTISQVEPALEQRDGPDWVPSEDPQLSEALDSFKWRGLNLDLQDIAGLMAYHRMVTGEHVVVNVTVGADPQTGEGGELDWRVYPVHACSFNKPRTGQVLIREVANGSVKNGTAYVVPKEAVHRCWKEHPSYPAQAWSPILSGIGPLERCASLASLMRVHSDARSTAGGGKALLYPEDWAEGMDNQGRDFDPVASAVADFGKLAADETDLRRLLPLMLHGKLTHDSKPFVLDLVSTFDPKVIEWWNAAMQEFSQAINLAGLTVAAGGAGTSNHWNEWIVQEDNWKGAFAPFADAVYDDITRLFLHGTYKGRLGATDITDYRVHYDPAAVIVPPDKKQTAVDMGREGILTAKAQATAGGFDDDDLLTEPDWDRATERNWFLQVKSAGRVQPEGGPPEQITVRAQEEINPATGKLEATGQNPPPPGGGNGQGPPPSNAPTAPAAGKMQRVAAAKDSPGARLGRVNTRLAKLKRATGQKLQANARAAVDSAIRNATGRAASIAGNAKQGTRLAAATRDLAIDLGGSSRPLDARRAYFREHGIPAPILAALGLTEEELLDDELGVYADQAGVDLDTYLQQRQDIIDGGDFDPNLGGSKDNAAAAALFLAAGATAIARGALTDGAAGPPASGEWSGIVPFSLISDALSVVAGTATSILPSSPDDQPTVAATDQLDAPFAIADDLGFEVAIYTWVHGSPDRPYEPHEALDGDEFNGDTMDFAEDGTPMSDAEAPDGFTDGDALYPGDHEGCTCDWDVEFREPQPGETGAESGAGYGTESGL